MWYRREAAGRGSNERERNVGSSGYKYRGLGNADNMVKQGETEGLSAALRRASEETV